MHCRCSEWRKRYCAMLASHKNRPPPERRQFKQVVCFFFQAEDGIRDYKVTGVQTCALPISFPVFAHNGEINTISRLREEARALGLPLSRDGSDSQDVDAAIRALVIRHGLTAVESIELLFPPIVNEMKRMTPELQDAYVQGRAAIGPLAQGPAGILVRVGDTCVFGVDALGLRPLWHVQTEDEHVFASERGFVPLERYVSDPVPLAPGERVALRRDRGWRLLDQGAVRDRFLTARRLRGVSMNGLRSHLTAAGPAEPIAAAKRWEVGTPPGQIHEVSLRRERQLPALGL